MTSSSAGYLQELEAHAKAVWGVETQQVYQCPNCDYYKAYSKHDEEHYCPGDGRKLQIKTVEVYEGEQEWKRRLVDAVEAGSDADEFNEWPLAPDANSKAGGGGSDE